MREKHRTLVLPDLHAPFHHPQAIEFLRRLKKDTKPTEIISIGDEGDFHGFSHFAHDPDVDSPGVELRKAQEALRPVFELFPVAMACESNHGMRPFRRALSAQLPRNCLRNINEIHAAPDGWRWQPRWLSHGICYTHGDGMSGYWSGLKAAQANHISTVIGHVHIAGGILYATSFTGRIFGANTGCLINFDEPVFNYARMNNAMPVLGTVRIIDGVPEYCPLEAWL